ncbi:MAG TPA: hypothetical protein VFS09_09410 [Candidatus Eisenbacteria bacterium]|nr:hypothetical protein [Candidatus Eisenbacteria bacterium]
MARESAVGAIRSASLRSFAPLSLLLLVQLVYLVLGLNLGTVAGMATAGTIARWIAGPDAVNYPAFLQVLPLTFSYVESLTFILIGAWALPRVAAMILAGSDPALANRERRAARVGKAFLPTFLSLLIAFAIVYGWQQIVPFVARPALSLFIHGGLEMMTATWAVSVLVGYAITTLFVYVPIVAVASDIAPMAALSGGLRDGLSRFWVTFPIAVVFSLPALLLQLAVQTSGSFLATRTRPENIAYVLIGYAILGSVGTYLLWSMATRLHRTSEEVR